MVLFEGGGACLILNGVVFFSFFLCVGWDVGVLNGWIQGAAEAKVAPLYLVQHHDHVGVADGGEAVGVGCDGMCDARVREVDHQTIVLVNVGVPRRMCKICTGSACTDMFEIRRQAYAPVRDDDGGALARGDEAVQRGLHDLLRLVVQRCVFFGGGRGGVDGVVD